MKHSLLTLHVTYIPAVLYETEQHAEEPLKRVGSPFPLVFFPEIFPDKAGKLRGRQPWGDTGEKTLVRFEPIGQQEYMGS